MEPDAAGVCAGEDFPADCESDFMSVWPADCFAPELFWDFVNAAKLLMPMTFAGSECAAKLLIRQSEWRMTFAASDFGAQTGPTDKAAPEIAAGSGGPGQVIIA